MNEIMDTGYGYGLRRTPDGRNFEVVDVPKDKPRTTDEIHDDITAAYMQDGPHDYAELGRLWREMARSAGREKAPGWAVLAAGLLADDNDCEARSQARLAGL